jgi:hypothetical protein
MDQDTLNQEIETDQVLDHLVLSFISKAGFVNRLREWVDFQDLRRQLQQSFLFDYVQQEVFPVN